MSLQYSVYILRCADDSYYVGWTRDIETRLEAHMAGTAATYTAARRPVEIVYIEPQLDPQSAVKRERQIKRWSRAKKEALVTGNLAKLQELSKRRRP